MALAELKSLTEVTKRHTDFKRHDMTKHFLCHSLSLM